jgi:hypothetical protein
MSKDKVLLVLDALERYHKIYCVLDYPILKVFPSEAKKVFLRYSMDNDAVLKPPFVISL